MPRPRKSPPPARPTSPPWWPIASLALCGILLYWASLSGPLIFDDFGSIGRNNSIRDLTDLARIAAPPASTPIAGRPVANFTFAINYALHGLDPAGYHAGNIALHITCALLIFALLRRSLAWPIAWAVALLWLVHPLNSEAVNYLSQRTEVLMAACYLFAVYASTRALDARAPWRWQAVAIAACAAGMGSKETMVTAPFAIVLYDRIFAFTSWRDALRARGAFYGGLAATWLVLALVVLQNGQTSTAGFASARVSSWLYFLNQMPVIARYLKLAFWPHPLVLYYGWPLPLTPADVWLPALLVFALTGVVVWALIRFPKIGYLGAWITLTLGPTSSVMPIGTEVAAERRMYLPLAALIALVVLGVIALVKRVRANGIAPSSTTTPWLGIGVTAAIALALGATTIARTRDYASALTMAALDVERWPTPQSHQVFGVELAGAGRHSEAIDHLRLAVDAYQPARYFLGSELLTTGKLDDAIVELQRFIVTEPDLPVVPNARIMMARALEAQSRAPEAIDQLRRALDAAPNRSDAHGQLANLLAGTQRYDEAIPHYRAFLVANPKNGDAWTGIAIAQISTGRSTEAAESFKSAVDANPQHPQFRFNYARVLIDQGNAREARAQLEAALQIDPTFAAAREVLSRLPR